MAQKGSKRAQLEVSPSPYSLWDPKWGVWSAQTGARMGCVSGRVLNTHSSIHVSCADRVFGQIEYSRRVQKGSLRAQMGV